MSWNLIATPSHGETSLRIVARQEPEAQGRFLLAAFDGDLWVHSGFYDWNRWVGHGMGLLLMPGFVKAAEKAASQQRTKL